MCMAVVYGWLHLAELGRKEVDKVQGESYGTRGYIGPNGTLVQRKGLWLQIDNIVICVRTSWARPDRWYGGQGLRLHLQIMRDGTIVTNRHPWSLEFLQFASKNERFLHGASPRVALSQISYCRTP